MPVQLINGLRDVVDQYDLFYIDQWGVLHNGVHALPGAVEALENLRKMDKQIVILSNSGKRIGDSYNRLEKIGISRDLYDHVVTSGETAHQNFKACRDPFIKTLGEKYFIFAWDENRDITKETKFYEVDSVDQADFILCAGTDSQDMSWYQPYLDQAIARDLPMVVSNPDLFAVDVDGSLKICPGSVAKIYEGMGGKVRWHGKPTAEIYQYSLNLLDNKGAGLRAIGIGDSLHHDIKGAENNGCDSLFITSGIHKEDLIPPIDARRINALSDQLDTAPTWALENFIW
jgi:HAD superfamily hydrolase (TIGR01459 family)